MQLARERIQASWTESVSGAEEHLEVSPSVEDDDAGGLDVDGGARVRCGWCAPSSPTLGRPRPRSRWRAGVLLVILVVAGLVFAPGEPARFDEPGQDGVAGLGWLVGLGLVVLGLVAGRCPGVARRGGAAGGERLVPGGRDPEHLGVVLATVASAAGGYRWIQVSRAGQNRPTGPSG